MKTDHRQQGKAYTPEQRASIIESLKPYLQLAYPRNRACDFIGFDATTLSKWVQADNSLSMKLTGWENEISLKARTKIRKDIESDKTDIKSAENWLKKKDRQEFGDNMDLTTNGDNLNISEVVWTIEDGSKKDEE